MKFGRSEKKEVKIMDEKENLYRGAGISGLGAGRTSGLGAIGGGGGMAGIGALHSGGGGVRTSSFGRKKS